MQSLINNPDVAKYRQLELAEAATIVEELLKDSLNVDFVRGNLHMLKKLLHLPNKWSKGKSKETQEVARNMIKRDLKEFTSRYMRIFLE